MNWISVKDKLPDQPGNYLVWGDSFTESFIRYFKDDIWWEDHCLDCGELEQWSKASDGDIIFWMPLPKPPLSPDFNTRRHYLESEAQKNVSLFQQALEYTPLDVELNQWLKSDRFGKTTSENYQYYVKEMQSAGIFPVADAAGNPFTIGHFRHIKHEKMLEWIKLNESLKESTKQLYIACYKSFLNHLERISYGRFKSIKQTSKSIPLRNKKTTRILTLKEWDMFNKALEQINHRDSLIARCMLQGARRVSEILEIKIPHIDFHHNIIHFWKTKQNGDVEEIPISYPATFMHELEEYIASTSDQRKESHLLFITRNGNPVRRSRLNHSFLEASKKANIQNVTPQMLRATWIALTKSKGISEEEIMKVTGHTTKRMIGRVEPNNENISQNIILI